MEDQHSRTQDRNNFQGLTLSMRDLVGIVFRRRRVIILSFAGLLAGGPPRDQILASDLRSADEDSGGTRTR